MYCGNCRQHNDAVTGFGNLVVCEWLMAGFQLGFLDHGICFQSLQLSTQSALMASTQFTSVGLSDICNPGAPVNTDYRTSCSYHQVAFVFHWRSVGRTLTSQCVPSLGSSQCLLARMTSGEWQQHVWLMQLGGHNSCAQRPAACTCDSTTAFPTCSRSTSSCACFRSLIIADRDWPGKEQKSRLCACVTQLSTATCTEDGCKSKMHNCVPRPVPPASIPVSFPLQHQPDRPD